MYLDVYGTHRQAVREFEKRVSAGFLRRLFNSLRHKPNELLSYEDVAARLHITGRHDIGIRNVPIECIVGSVGRVHDFDREFYPLSEGLRDRWCYVAGALYAGRDLPPIDLYKIVAAYFVIDGNHRVSVMRHIGQETVEAHIIELETPDCFDLYSGEPSTCLCEN